MTVLALGCSFTAKHYPDVDPWPEVIARMTGETVINYGVAGSGNKHSVDKFLKHLKDCDGQYPKKVYWLLTEWDRYDINDKDRHSGVWTVKPVTESKENYKKLMKERLFQLNSFYTEEHWIKYEKELNINNLISSVILKKLPIEDIINYNMNQIKIVQELCKKLNIELKMMQGVSVLETSIFKDIHSSDIVKMILESAKKRNIDISDFIGFPFYPAGGGLWVGGVYNWLERYGREGDGHPSQRGADLIANIFLGKVNIFNYK